MWLWAGGCGNGQTAVSYLDLKAGTFCGLGGAKWRDCSEILRWLEVPNPNPGCRRIVAVLCDCELCLTMSMPMDVQLNRRPLPLFSDCDTKRHIRVFVVQYE